MPHKFKIGDIVKYRPTHRDRRTPTSECTVISFLRWTVSLNIGSGMSVKTSTESRRRGGADYPRAAAPGSRGGPVPRGEGGVIRYASHLAGRRKAHHGS